MNHSAEPDMLKQLDAVFAQLDPQSVAQFYAAYQQWTLQQRLADLQQRIALVRQQQAHNEQRIRQAQPSPIALAALARLQSNGVSDIELLDTMLERGEAWLDQTMQRLDYCEQFSDFIADDYTRWCERALEGAFDWIDSLRDATDIATTHQEASSTLEALPEAVVSGDDDASAVEALLLQKLASEEEPDDLSWQEITLKQAAVRPPPPAPEEIMDDTPLEPPEQLEIAITEYIPQDGTDQSDETPGASYPASSTSAEEYITPEEPQLETGVTIEDNTQSEGEQPALIEFALSDEPPDGEIAGGKDDHQPALIEFSPVETQSDASLAPESVSEQPALVEFTALSELSPVEDSTGNMSEQIAPAEIAAPVETAQSKATEPAEVENIATGETVPHEEKVISMIETSASVHIFPKKRGWLQRLFRRTR